MRRRDRRPSRRLRDLVARRARSNRARARERAATAERDAKEAASARRDTRRERSERTCNARARARGTRPGPLPQQRRTTPPNLEDRLSHRLLDRERGELPPLRLLRRRAPVRPVALAHLLAHRLGLSDRHHLLRRGDLSLPHRRRASAAVPPCAAARLAHLQHRAQLADAADLRLRARGGAQSFSLTGRRPLQTGRQECTWQAHVKQNSTYIYIYIYMCVSPARSSSAVSRARCRSVRRPPRGGGETRRGQIDRARRCARVREEPRERGRSVRQCGHVSERELAHHGARVCGSDVRRRTPRQAWWRLHRTELCG